MRPLILLSLVCFALSAVPAVAADWHTVETFKGPAQVKGTESFSIPDREWRITWNAKGKGNLIITVKDANTDLSKAVVANVVGPNKDSSIMRGAGTYYLNLIAGTDYEIKIETKH